MQGITRRLIGFYTESNMGRLIGVCTDTIIGRLIGLYIASIKCLYASVWTVLPDAD
jgi:hypothetical protein